MSFSTPLLCACSRYAVPVGTTGDALGSAFLEMNGEQVVSGQKVAICTCSIYLSKALEEAEPSFAVYQGIVGRCGGEIDADGLCEGGVRGRGGTFTSGCHQGVKGCERQASCLPRPRFLTIPFAAPTPQHSPPSPFPQPHFLPSLRVSLCFSGPPLSHNSWYMELRMLSIHCMFVLPVLGTRIKIDTSCTTARLFPVTVVLRW